MLLNQRFSSFLKFLSLRLWNVCPYRFIQLHQKENPIGNNHRWEQCVTARNWGKGEFSKSGQDSPLCRDQQTEGGGLVASVVSDTCNPMDCSPPGSSAHGILQARILEWVAISFSRGSSQPRDRTQVSCTAGGFFSNWARRPDLSV